MTDDEDAVGRVAQGAVIVFVGNLLGMALAFATRVSAANLLSQSGYGLFVFGMTLVMILSLVGNLGLYEGLAQTLPQSDDRREIFTAGLLLSVVASVGVTSLVVLSSGYLSTFFSGGGYTRPLVVFAASIPLYAVFRVATGGFRGVEDATGRVLVQNVLMRGTVFIAVLGMLWYGHGVIGAAVGWTTAFALTSVFAVLLLSRRVDLLAPVSAWPTAVAKHGQSLLSLSLPLMGAASIWQLLQETDTILLGLLVASADLGVYDASFTIAKLIMLFFWPVGFLFLPVFSNLDAVGNETEQRRLFLFATKWLAAFTLPLYLVLVVYPGPIISLIFRNDYVIGRTALTIVASGFFVHVLAGTNRQALIGLGYSRIIFRGTAAAFLVNLILNALLIPRFGFEGAGVATALTFVLLNVLFGVELYRRTGLHPLSRRLFRTIVLSAASFAAITALLDSIALPVPAVALPVIATVLYLPVHLVLILFGGFLTRGDIDQLHQFNETLPVDTNKVVNWLERHIH